jgi:hypothetical protein
MGMEIELCSNQSDTYSQSIIIMINKNKVAGMGGTILVSGVTGTVGSEVVKQLSSHTDINIKAAGPFRQKNKTLRGR